MNLAALERGDVMGNDLLSLTTLIGEVADWPEVRSAYILDACRTPLRQGGRSTTYSAEVEDLLSGAVARDLAQRKRGTDPSRAPLPASLVMNACADGQQAFEVEGLGRGLFSFSFCHWLQQGAAQGLPRVLAAEVLGELTEHIDVQARQHKAMRGQRPWLNPQAQAVVLFKPAFAPQPTAGQGGHRAGSRAEALAQSVSRKVLDERRWKVACIKNTAEAYEAYLYEASDGSTHELEAIACMSKLLRRTDAGQAQVAARNRDQERWQKWVERAKAEPDGEAGSLLAMRPELETSMFRDQCDAELLRIEADGLQRREAEALEQQRSRSLDPGSANLLKRRNPINLYTETDGRVIVNFFFNEGTRRPPCGIPQRTEGAATAADLNCQEGGPEIPMYASVGAQFLRNALVGIGGHEWALTSICQWEEAVAEEKQRVPIGSETQHVVQLVFEATPIAAVIQKPARATRDAMRILANMGAWTLELRHNDRGPCTLNFSSFRDEEPLFHAVVRQGVLEIVDAEGRGPGEIAD